MSGERVVENASEAGKQTRLVVVCGLPGAGKTTVAEHAVDALDATLFRTDVVRKDLFPDPEYTREEMRAVYDELFSRAEDAVADGDAVVLDGTFKRREYRGRARRAAEELGVPFTLVRVACEEDVVRERIRARSGDASDADFEIHQQYREEFESLAGEHARVDNSGTLEETLAQVDRLF
ncbi:AAA family ATPase [Halobacterium litoreum]|uniref:AAA family ATPase n=1 Tax=Halobacterium litoreum TaxID=2039234 RepID=A0ABD5NDL2_9EURY|nr:AAA family ATPase [Halobacterium litoreum]UHH13702.1 AAA family ATPase [Halobacterium litoreum]